MDRPTSMHKTTALRIAFALGSMAHVEGYAETSSSLISRSGAIYSLKANDVPSTTSNVDAYLRGVAHTLVSA